RDQHSNYNYFIMREGQFELLENMLSLATRIPRKDDVSKLVPDFYFNLAGSIHPGNTAIVFLNDLEELGEKLKEKELPQTQEELEAYLRLKNRFKKTDLKKMNKNKKIKTDII